jgi:hypothetical protein
VNDALRITIEPFGRCRWSRHRKAWGRKLDMSEIDVASVATIDFWLILRTVLEKIRICGRYDVIISD